MVVLVLRRWLSEHAAVGRVYIGLRRFGYSLEDAVRKQKLPGETAIWYGMYQVKKTYSPKFGREMPEIIGVRDFTGIRIHPGTTAVDTEGCLLVGYTRGGDMIGESRKACADLEELMNTQWNSGRRVWIVFLNWEQILGAVLALGAIAVSWWRRVRKKHKKGL